MTPTLINLLQGRPFILRRHIVIWDLWDSYMARTPFIWPWRAPAELIGHLEHNAAVAGAY